MIARLKDKLRALTREAIADVLALEAERDALRVRAEKAEREAERYKHDATKAAAERDAWRSRALKAETSAAGAEALLQRVAGERVKVDAAPAAKPAALPPLPTKDEKYPPDADADAAARVAFAPVEKPEEAKAAQTEAAQAAEEERAERKRHRSQVQADRDACDRLEGRKSQKLRIPAPAAREEQRRREIKATRAVGCPTCDAGPGEDCEEGDRRGPFHPDRWTEGKRRLALADGALAIACDECKAEPGAWCVVDGRKGLHKTRQNDAAKE